MQKDYYVFRQPRSIEELEDPFHLRYNVYRNSRLAKFEPESHYGININTDDLGSFPFGLFLNNKSSSAIISRSEKHSGRNILM
jgi:hypothetical protein